MDHSYDSEHGLVESVQSNVSVGTTSVALVGANPNRPSLTLLPPDQGTVTFSLLETAVAGQGIMIATGEQSITLCSCKHSDLSFRAWSVIASQAGSNVSVIEGKYSG